ncbi:MAG: hypothetical protein IVW56_09585 [Candidatus Binataceae bacterium]|nr:hypothetical protein [Candidatus Binataceae bacterium]
MGDLPEDAEVVRFPGSRGPAAGAPSVAIAILILRALGQLLAISGQLAILLLAAIGVLDLLGR